MTPIIYVCLGVTPCCFVATYLLKDDAFLSRLFGVVGVLPILIACGMFVYFGICKTDKLQSEDYQIKQELLEMALSKGGTIKIKPLALEAILHPDDSATEGAGKDKK